MKRMIAIETLMLLVLVLPAYPQFTDWTPPQNLGPVLNTEFVDSCVAISKNGLSLFFSSNRQTGNPTSMDRDLYVSKRDAIGAPWGAPVPLASINTANWESCPALSLDEHQLYFTSIRPGGCGAEDFWVSRRRDRKDDFGWEAPSHLACEAEGGVNSAGRDLTPAIFEDEAGRVFLYFTRNRPSTPFFDIYQIEMRDDGTFGPATPVEELNGAEFHSSYPVVRRDGLEVIFGSNRPGGSGNAAQMDFWAATRPSTQDKWSPPAFVPSLGAPAWMQGRIALSFDGRELYFTSLRAGGYGAADLWVARREKRR